MISIKKLWEQIAVKHDALIAEQNYGEAFEALTDLIQYLDECAPYNESELKELIKDSGINIKEVAE